MYGQEGHLPPPEMVENWEAAVLICCPDCGDEVADGGRFLKKFDPTAPMEG